MEYQGTLICKHTFQDAMPDHVVIKQSLFTVAICDECASVDFDEAFGTLLFPARPSDNIPNRNLWNIGDHFPKDGEYKLEDGKYVLVPELPPAGNA